MRYNILGSYFLFGVVVGAIVGVMKNYVCLWTAVGAGLGFLIALILEKMRLNKATPEKVAWLGFFLLFPVMFFNSFIKGTVWFDVFGILAVMGTFILVVNFAKIIRSKRKK